MIRVDVALKLGASNLDDDFENDADIIALFSSSGKSMTINLIAGLTRPDCRTPSTRPGGSHRASWCVLDNGPFIIDSVMTRTNLKKQPHAKYRGQVGSKICRPPGASRRRNQLAPRWRVPLPSFDRSDFGPIP